MNPGAVDAEPLGPKLRLAGRLLTGHVEHRAIAGKPIEGGEQERRFTDARVAAEEHERARDEPATEHAVELAYASGLSRLGVEPDLREKHRLRGRAEGAAQAGGTECLL